MGSRTRLIASALLGVLLVAVPASAQDSPPAKKEPGAVDRALAYLARTQRPDGSWEAPALAEPERPGPAGPAEPTGSGHAGSTALYTALALVAFLGAGETHQTGPYMVNVKNGLIWLRSQQDQRGLFSADPESDLLFEDQIVATLAMTEAFGMTQSKVWDGPARAGIAFLVGAREADGGWGRYPGARLTTAEVTADVLLVLRSAEMAGLAPDRRFLEEGAAFLTRCTDAKTGRAFTQPSAASAKTSTVREDLGLSARVALARIFAAKDGPAAVADQACAKLVARITASPPRVAEKASQDELRGLQAQASLVQQVRGRDDPWIAKLLELVRKRQGADGSWSWGHAPSYADDLPTWETAMSAQILQTPYRYPRRVDEKPKADAPPAPAPK